MSDELLRALGERQKNPGPPRDSEGGEVSADIKQEVLRPFEGAELEALLDTALAQVDRNASAAPSSDATAEEAEGLFEEPARLPRRSSRPTLAIGVAVALAIAAAVLLWLGPRLAADPSGLRAPPPSYTVTRLEGGVASMRSTDPEIPTALELTAHDPVDWAFAPQAPVRTPMAVALLATPSDGEAILATPKTFETSDEGVLRIVGPLSQSVELSPGTWAVTVIIGPPETLPKTVAAAADGDGWSRVALELTILSSP